MKNVFVALGLSALSFASHSAVIETNIVENFAKGDFKSDSNQNKGEYTVLDVDGGRLDLGTEAWTYISTEDLFGLRSLNLDNRFYSLNFDMRISQGDNNPGMPSEIGGVMVADGETVKNIDGNDGVFGFNLSGTQNWGSKAFRYDFDNLDNGTPTWQSFNIDLSSALNGQYQYLVFMNDCDDENCSNSTQFRNISVEVPEPSSLAILALSMAGLVQLRRKK